MNKKPRWSKETKREMVKGYLFIASSFIGFIRLSLSPLVMALVLSLSEWDLVSSLGGMEFIGMGSLAKLLRDNTFETSFKNNVLSVVWSMPVLLVMGFIGAATINELRQGKSSFKVIYFLPYISNSIAVVAVWRVTFQPTYGSVSNILHELGMANPPGWLVSPDWALFVVTLMFVWQQLGYYVLLYTMALAAVSSDLYEATQIDGTGKIRTTLKITVPMVTPTTFFLSVTGVTASFKVLDSIQVLTQGGPGNSSSALVYYLYKVSFQQYKLGYGTTISMILFLVVSLVTAIQWRRQKSWTNY